MKHIKLYGHKLWSNGAMKGLEQMFEDAKKSGASACALEDSPAEQGWISRRVGEVAAMPRPPGYNLAVHMEEGRQIYAGLPANQHGTRERGHMIKNAEILLAAMHGIGLRCVGALPTIRMTLTREVHLKYRDLKTNEGFRQACVYILDNAFDPTEWAARSLKSEEAARREIATVRHELTDESELSKGTFVINGEHEYQRRADADAEVAKRLVNSMADGETLVGFFGANHVQPENPNGRKSITDYLMECDDVFVEAFLIHPETGEINPCAINAQRSVPPHEEPNPDSAPR